MHYPTGHNATEPVSLGIDDGFQNSYLLDGTLYNASIQNRTEYHKLHSLLVAIIAEYENWTYLHSV